MLCANGTISISINIGKHDSDIASWFNLLTKSGQSRSMWASALLMAYSQGYYLETGCVFATSTASSPPQKQQNISTQAVLLGSGNSLQKRKSRKYGWTVKGTAGEFIIGSVVTLRLTNKHIIEIYWTLRSQKIPISTLLKDMIRKGLRYGDIEVAPNPLDAKKILSSCLSVPYQMNLSLANMASTTSCTESYTVPVPDVSASDKTTKPSSSSSRNPLLDFI